MMQNPREEKELTTSHVLHLCLPSSGEEKYGGKTIRCTLKIVLTPHYIQLNPPLICGDEYIFIFPSF